VLLTFHSRANMPDNLFREHRYVDWSVLGSVNGAFALRPAWR
jgi:hypothetical protein